MRTAVLGNQSVPSQTPAGTQPGKPGFNRILLVVLMVVVIVAAALVSIVAFSATVVATKPFTYTEPVSQTSSSPSLKIVNVNGGVNVVSWSQSNMVINGTVTARGVGASTSSIVLDESNSNGIVSFQPRFPTGFMLSGGYAVDVNVYMPTSIQNVTLTTVNGNVVASFSPIMGGTYHLATTSGNVNLSMPVASSCRIDASTTIGTVHTSGMSLNNMMAQTGNHMSGMLGTGTATMTLTTTTGDITITGT